MLEEPDTNPADLEEEEDNTQFSPTQYSHNSLDEGGSNNNRRLQATHPEQEMALDFGAETRTKNVYIRDKALMERNIVSDVPAKDAVFWEPVMESHKDIGKDYAQTGVRGAFETSNNDRIDHLEYFIHMFPWDWKECLFKLNLHINNIVKDIRSKK